MSRRPVNGHVWHVDDAGMESVWFLDDSNQAWMVPVSRDTEGQIVLGQETSFPWVFSSDAFAYATDVTGRCWTIEPGVDDGPPNHLVVIENWLPSVMDDDK
ncbi:MAG: hypothetical protein MK101_04335 [Phycisphaerales bacterium]|nr:hypothetical protein [Phycisphaerales bacterium]